MAKIEKADFGYLRRITDLSGNDCPDEEEKDYVGYCGLILTLVSEYEAPGREFVKFYPNVPKAIFKEELTTHVGRITKTLDTLILQSRFDKKYVFYRDYDLTPDEKFILRIRAGLEK